MCQHCTFLYGKGVKNGNKQFFNDIVINDKETALRFVEVLERAEKAPHKKINVKYRNITDSEEIKRMFLR